MNTGLGRAATVLVPEAGGHICVVVDDERSYAELATGFLAEGNARGEKTVAFGPESSALQERLRPLVAIAADPYVDFLGRGALEPETMFTRFREEAAIAIREGFTRLRVAADMDWLLPASRGGNDALHFEVLLDRVVAELDATVLCAYRRGSFKPDTILGMLCTHPVTAGHDEQPPFKLLAGDEGAWTLSGEIDCASSSVLAPALKATAAAPWILDVAGLAFADVAGMRTIATTAVEADTALELRGVSASLRHYWNLARFDDVAPRVRLAA